MSNEQINIAIAEACGWRKGDLRPGWCHPDNWSMAKNGSYGVWVGQDKLPNYCNDLNAMHEAEKVLTADQWYEYDQLMPLRDPQKMHATARQRADTFLRTLEKLEEA